MPGAFVGARPGVLLTQHESNAMAIVKSLWDTPDGASMLERCHALIAAKGLTGEAIAEKATSEGYLISVSGVTKFLRGDTLNPGMGTLICIARGLGVTLPLLFGMTAEGYFHPLAFRTAAFLHEELTREDNP